MFAAPAPERGRSAACAPLRVAALVHRRFGPGDRRLDDAFAQRHVADLVRPFGVVERPDVAARGDANSFTTMTAALLGELAGRPDAPLRPAGSRRPVDMAVVAHSTPDVDCREAAVTHLSHVLPGAPLAFSVSDCGVTAVFSALRLAAGYAGRCGHRRALVVALDQRSLPYETGVDVAGDAGAALLLDAGGPDGSGGAGGACALGPVHRTAGGEAGDLARWLAGLAGERTTVVAGSGIDPDTDLAGHGGAVVAAPAGLPASGLLTAFGGHRPWWSGEGERIVLADRDRGTGELCALVVDRERA